MEANHHRFSELFAQLGLPADPAGIATFIQRHSPLSADVLLAEARAVMRVSPAEISSRAALTKKVLW